MRIHVARFSTAIVIVAAAWMAGIAAPASAAPANDNFASAQTIGPAVPLTVPSSNVGATTEANEPEISSSDIHATVWYKWTAPSNAPVVVDLCDSAFSGDPDPYYRFAVYTGNVLNALTKKMEESGDCLNRFTPVSGTEYKIQVEFGIDQGTFSFKLRPLAPPSNDGFAAPKIIPSTLPTSLATTNLDATFEAGEPAILGGTNSRSVWYAWTAPSTGQVRLDVCEDQTKIVGSLDKAYGVFTGNTLGTLVPVATEPYRCHLDFNVTAGTPYRLGIGGGSNVNESKFTISIINAPPPSNDNFANAVAVGPGLPVTTAGDNSFATIELGEPDHGPSFNGAHHSAWYSWTPSQSQRVRIKTCPVDSDPKTTFSAYTGVYTGAAVNALTKVGEKSDESNCSVLLDAVAGTTYRIAAAGDASDEGSGPFTLDIHVLKVPANDNFANAQDIGTTVPVAVKGSTVDATTEEDEPSHSDLYGSSGGGNSVWYRWTAPSDEAAIFSACSATNPNIMAVYTDERKPDETLYGLTIVAKADKGCGDGTVGTKLAIAPEMGKTYYFAVAVDRTDYESDFTFTHAPPIAPVITPPKAPFNLKKAIAKCKKIKGKSKKAKKKRANCIKAAKKKAAIIKCQKLTSKSAQAKCIKKARKKFK